MKTALHRPDFKRLGAGRLAGHFRALALYLEQQEDALQGIASEATYKDLGDWREACRQATTQYEAFAKDEDNIHVEPKPVHPNWKDRDGGDK